MRGCLYENMLAFLSIVKVPCCPNLNLQGPLACHPAGEPSVGSDAHDKARSAHGAPNTPCGGHANHLRTQGGPLVCRWKYFKAQLSLNCEMVVLASTPLPIAGIGSPHRMPSLRHCLHVSSDGHGACFLKSLYSPGDSN